MENLLDQYSLFHFAIGIIFYFFGISLPFLLLKYTIFIILENTKNGIKFMNKYMKFWPDKKKDDVIGSIRNLFLAFFGWYSSKLLNY